VFFPICVNFGVLACLGSVLWKINNNLNGAFVAGCL
jgi:hypothetical protein